jgi:prepilin-type N-terminal cleavage/methylation domain-containing protein
MNRDEQGFTLIETLVALMVVTTLMCFVVPLYLTGKAFSQERMLADKARLLAQAELEKRLAYLQTEKRVWHNVPYVMVAEVTQKNSLWKIQVTVQWKDIHQKQQSLMLTVYRYHQSEASPT